MRKSKRLPLLVSISGPRHVGVTSACDRISRCLNGMGFNTVIVRLTTAREVVNFDDNFLMGKYIGVDVILFDKHFNTESAARRRLETELWFDDSVELDLSVLIIPATSDKDRHLAYLKMRPAHFGTDNHHVVSSAGKDGQLYAAGNIKLLILKEMTDA